MSVSFAALGVPEDLAANLAARNITEPYPIQAATLKESLAGDDISAQAPTGSGKTLAFGIPLLARVDRARPHHPRALVLAPTRELAAQIAEELTLLGRARKRRIATFYGGVGFGKQLDALRAGVDIAVGCPGRLLDLRNRHSLHLDEVEIVVVDEADRMSDMGFLPVVRELLNDVRGAHQTMLFSATLQGDVERLVSQYQRSPKRHVLDAPADAMGSRTHEFWRAERTDRPRLTVDIAAAHSSTIVFCRTKHGVDRLQRQLIQAGITAVALHGDRTQVQRDRALAQFHAREVQVLVGTDVAARGLHVDDVGCVVHFDPPEDGSTYVHRSGRTGRAGSEGVVISLVTGDQQSAVRKIQKSLGMPQHFDDPSVPRSEPRPAVAMPSSSASQKSARPTAPYDSPNRRQAKAPMSARRSSSFVPRSVDPRRRQTRRPKPNSAA